MHRMHAYGHIHISMRYLMRFLCGFSRVFIASDTVRSPFRRLVIFVSSAVLPSEAHAKIVFRLVAGQSPDRVYSLLEQHVAEVAPSLAPGLSLGVQRLNPGARAFKANRESLGFNVAQEVLYDVYGKEPVLTRTGGSVNAFADFSEILQLENVSFGFGASDSYQHAPDERMRLESLYFGQHAYLSMWLTIASISGFLGTDGLEEPVHSEL